MRVSLVVASLVLGSVVAIGDSIYDGTGSLINPNQACWGCDRDEAMMHPHKNKNSTVTFQVLYNSAKCTNIAIHSDANLGEEVLINLKSWDKPLVKKSYKAKLPVGNYKYENGVSVKMESYWTTLAISSTKPINKDISIYAYCRSDATDTLNESGIYKLSSPLPTKLDNNHYHLGNGSLISKSEDNGQGGYGTIKDEAITSNTYDAETSFQVLSSKDKCEEVTIFDKSDSSKFEKILWKGWSEEKWKNSDCTKLPCVIKTPLKSNGESDYILVNIKTKSGENGVLRANCGKKKVKFNIKDNLNRPKHTNDCKFNDVKENYWGHKYITALCSSGILEGYGKREDNPNYIPYSEYGPNESTLWQELTKVVSLTENFNKTKKIRSKYPKEPWSTAYVDIAKKEYTFIQASEMEVTRGLAFRYIAKVFWSKILSEEEAASFLKSKNVITNTNTTNYLTRGEMAKSVLRASNFSAYESGLERKLVYANHGNTKLEEKIKETKDIPEPTLEKIDKDDTKEEKEEKIEKNRQEVEKKNITFSSKNSEEKSTDNLQLVEKITDMDEKFKSPNVDELIKKVKQEGIYEESNEPKEESVVFMENQDTGEKTVGTSGKKDKITGDIPVTLETKNGEINSVNEEKLKGGNMKVIGNTPTEDIGSK